MSIQYDGLVKYRLLEPNEMHKFNNEYERDLEIVGMGRNKDDTVLTVYYKAIPPTIPVFPIHPFMD